MFKWFKQKQLREYLNDPKPIIEFKYIKSRQNYVVVHKTES